MHDRRLAFRIPFEAMVTSYVHDRPVRGLVADLGDGGMGLSAVSVLAPPPGMLVGVELELPGIDDSIWALGKICYRRDDRLASGLGVRFVEMARSQARLLRDFCIDVRRRHLGSILSRIRSGA